ncbi:MAG TPA: hypothetical protein V6D11_07565 [Waterburya sp.]|jgi:hypothetical protein
MEPYWHYFLTIEEELVKFSRYIEFHEDNYKTYSIELARIQLSVGSEIDVVAKLLCQNLGCQKAKNICDYNKIILATYPNLPDFVVEIPRYRLEFTPCKDWKPANSPKWWTNYNKVKHQRSSHYQEANLENVLQAMAGLITINLYYLKNKGSTSGSGIDICMDYEMRPKLFFPSGFHREIYASGLISWQGNLP